MAQVKSAHRDVAALHDKIRRQDARRFFESAPAKPPYTAYIKEFSLSIWMYGCIYLHIYVYISIYPYIYTHTHREEDQKAIADLRGQLAVSQADAAAATTLVSASQEQRAAATGVCKFHEPLVSYISCGSILQWLDGSVDRALENH